MLKVKTSKHRGLFPAIHGVTITGLGPAIDAEVSRYGWCDIPEIGRVMRGHFIELGAGEWHDLWAGHGDIFDRYGFLNTVGETRCDKPLVTWMQFDNIELYGNRPPDSTSPYGLRVPAGWVKLILKLVVYGIVRVVCVKTPIPGIQVDDETYVDYQLYGDVCKDSVIKEKLFEISKIGTHIRLTNTETKKQIHLLI